MTGLGEWPLSGIVSSTPNDQMWGALPIVRFGQRDGQLSLVPDAYRRWRERPAVVARRLRTFLSFALANVLQMANPATGE
jgi:hypothetical protein